MSGDIRLFKLQGVSQLALAMFSITKKLDDANPVRVSEGGKQFGEKVVLIHYFQEGLPYDYLVTCQYAQLLMPNQ